MNPYLRSQGVDKERAADAAASDLSVKLSIAEPTPWPRVDRKDS